MDEQDGLVDDALAEQLRAACRTAVGDSLRSVTYFTPTAFEQLYLRADLQSDADLAGFVEHESDGFHATTAYRGSELGDYGYTVRAFENGFLTRLTVGDSGVFVTTDGLTIRRSEEVAEAIRSVLAEPVTTD
ncbi:DUF7522 family protein [Salinirubrum litoreum]|uniref:Uncharacterized protein n=1 Tax=Salinirubrum litoreum TaxID=1126234 RepID=A0ABD5RBS5_9EURY|nr:hypothetical protein [Salinirubrum litoreum]